MKNLGNYYNIFYLKKKVKEIQYQGLFLLLKKELNVIIKKDLLIIN